MSGPKSVFYDVARLAAVRAAAVAALTLEIRVLREHLRFVATQIEEARRDGVTDLPVLFVVVASEPENLAAMDAEAAALRSALHTARTGLTIAVASQRVRDAIAVVDAGETLSTSRLAGEVLTAQAPERQAKGGEQQAKGGEQQAATAIIGRLLGRLPPDVPTMLLEQVEKTAARAANGAPQRLDQLRVLVEQCEAAAEGATRARALLTESLGLPGTDVNELRTVLLDVESGQRRASAREWNDWTAQITRAQRHAEQQYVLATAQEALTNLGYDLGPEFVTTLAADQSLTVPRADMGGYAVRFRGDGSYLHMNLVREASTPASRDTAAETSFCSDLDEMRTQLGQAGVLTNLTRALPVGAAAVLAVPAVPKVSGSAQRRATTKKQKARRLEP